MNVQSYRQLGSVIFLAVLACLLLANRSVAQGVTQATPAPQLVRVGVYVSPPFVMKEGNSYSGMAIELWQKVAAGSAIASEFVEYPTYADLVDAVKNSQVDAAVTDLSITEDRAKVVDFSHSWFDSGLRVMVHSDPNSSISTIIDDLREAGHLRNFGWIALCIMLGTIIVTIIDRLFDEEFPQSWREGFAENFYHMISLATQGETSRKNLFGWVGRIWQGLWLLVSVAVVAYVTSSITSVMTASHIANRINSVTDLHGKTVAVRAGSVAEKNMKQQQIRTVPFPHIEDAVNALLNREVNAVVADNPALEYFAHTHPDLPLDVVGDTFDPEKYGFAFPPGSALTKPVSLGVIALRENGVLKEMKTRYFGFDP